MTEEKVLSLTKVLSVLGLILAIYLLWQQFFRPAFQPCRVNSTINCDAIITGAVSKTFGVPTPIFGFVGYSLILIASIFRYKKTILACATLGLLFCLWIGTREIFELHVICPVCIGCQVIMIVVFILALMANRPDK